MTVLLAEVYDALRSIPGMDDTKARRAAEALGASENRTADNDRRIDRVESKIDSIEKNGEGLSKKFDRLEVDVQSLKTDVTLLKWMTGFVLAGIVVALGKLLTL